MKFVNNVWLEQSKIYCCRFLLTWLIYLLSSFFSNFVNMSNWVTHVSCLRQGQPREQQHQCTYVPQLSLTICPAPPLRSPFPSLPSLSLSHVLRFFSKFTLNFQLTAVLMSGLGWLSLSLSANDPGRDSERYLHLLSLTSPSLARLVSVSLTHETNPG